MNPRVRNVKYRSPYTLELIFTNSEIKEFDLSPCLNYPVFEKLKDESYCKKVRVQFGTVFWDENTDFDPDTLYLEGRSLVASAS